MIARRSGRPDAVTRTARAIFSASACISLYTAAGFGSLLLAGVAPATACAFAALAGVAGAGLAAAIVYRSELRQRRARLLEAQLESARERSAAAEEPKGPSREERESREIQAALLPRELPSVSGYHIEADYRPCGSLGGDFYDVRRLADGRLLLTLGDVSGKGPAGAIVMAMVQTLFREHAAAASGPADLLARVNAGFQGALGKGVFVTAVAALLDTTRHRLTLAGAGHHPVLLLNPRERRSMRVGASGPALGLLAAPRFAESLAETTLDLGEGDVLLLYTDGATDCVQDLATGVGENRFLAAAAAAILPGVTGALERISRDLWQGGGRRDDTTLLLVSRLGLTLSDRPMVVPTQDRVKS